MGKINALSILAVALEWNQQMILTQSKPTSQDTIHLITKKSVGSLKDLRPDQRTYVKKRIGLGVEVIPVVNDENIHIIATYNVEKDRSVHLEKLRLIFIMNLQ